MKARTFLPMLMIVWIALSQTVISGEPFTINFTTLGNCYICKIRIETKVNQLSGVISSEWDYITKVTTVTYDTEVTDAFQVMQTIADTGHDTEWYEAPDSMYALLIGSCCEYERTINYTNVQIGYLSLMGIWVYPLGTAENLNKPSFYLFPTVGDGLIHLQKGGDSPSGQVTVEVFSMAGKLVWTGLRNPDYGETINLTTIPGGQYIVTIHSGNSIVSRHRIVLI